MKTTVIGEIGCNHRGDFETAIEMITNLVEFCGVKAIKFQKRDNKSLLSEEEYNSPHPVIENSYGQTYGAHREFLEFSKDQHAKLKAHCDNLGATYSSSVWDLKSVDDIVSIGSPFIKVPSATNLNFPVLKRICNTFDGVIHISLGMTTLEEEEEIVAFVSDAGRLKDTVLYACTSGYPVKHEELYLYEITRLLKQYGASVKGIGFSGHHLGISADIAAVTLGATYVERHYTFDRTWKGTDHAASLEPDGMRRLSRDIKNIEMALQFKAKTLNDTEAAMRKKLKRRVAL